MIPLAERMRPARLDQIIGQPKLLGPQGVLRRMLSAERLSSLLLWGPPGVGKTTLARVLAAESGRQIVALSAVQCGVKELRAALAQLPTQPAGVLFIDEVHRFNKGQQDALLPAVESGQVVLIGATTENPSFSVNRALLSRLQVLVLESMDEAALVQLLERALISAEGLNGSHRLDADALARLVALADGDARRALNMLEQAAAADPAPLIDSQRVAAVVSAQPRAFDRGGDVFYEQISALHKAIRGSDPDAALYWLARMLDGGCDPLYLARRLIRIASEDIGNADPRLLGLCLDAAQAYERLGSPEGELALAQAASYLACAPKSNALYQAWGEAQADAREHGSLPVPERLRNASTGLREQLGHGAGYRYAHDEPGGVALGEHYLPDALRGRHYYQPTERGLERSIGEKLAQIRAAQAAR